MSGYTAVVYPKMCQLPLEMLQEKLLIHGPGDSQAFEDRAQALDS